MHKYVFICTNMHDMLNLQLKYAQGKICHLCKFNIHKYSVCTKYAKICKNMQWPHKYFSPAFICIYMHNICKKYARYVSIKFICNISKNMHSPLCWCHWQTASDTNLLKSLRSKWQETWISVLERTWKSLSQAMVKYVVIPSHDEFKFCGPAWQLDQHCADTRRKLHPPFVHLCQSRASW